MILEERLEKRCVFVPEFAKRRARNVRKLSNVALEWKFHPDLTTEYLLSIDIAIDSPPTRSRYDTHSTFTLWARSNAILPRPMAALAPSRRARRLPSTLLLRDKAGTRLASLNRAGSDRRFGGYVWGNRKGVGRK